MSMSFIFAEGDRLAILAAAQRVDAEEVWPVLALSTFEISRYKWRLEAILESPSDQERVLAMVREAAPGLAPHCRAVPDTDWVALSLAGLPAIHAGRFAIAGAHARDQIGPGKKVVIIEASEAFGTGHHGTTRGCLLALDGLYRRREKGFEHLQRFLDIGTGSGILSIAAAKAGASTIWASEIDKIAAKHARENAKANHVTHLHCLTRPGAQHKSIRSAAPFDVIFANILFRPLVRLAPSLVPLVRAGGRIIVSGLLQVQEPLARAAYTGRGLVVEKRIRLDGWITLVLRKPPASHTRKRDWRLNSAHSISQIAGRPR